MTEELFMTFNALQKKMIGHAALVMFVAMLAGMGLLISLVGGMELMPGSIVAIDLPGNSAAWARTHVGGLLNAMLVFLMAIIIFGLGFNEKSLKRIAWIFIATAWGNTVFYWAALFAPNRALTFGTNRFGESNLASIIGLVPGFVFVALSMIGVIMIARKAFNKAN
jgi:tetrahydromethanopterin S-methyltransferase subunit F